MSDSSLKLKIQRIIEYEELPKIFHNENRRLQASLDELWLIDQSLGIDLIAPQEIIGHISINALNNGDREFNCFFISEIIYKFKGRWKM